MNKDDFTKRFNILVGENRMQFSFNTLIPYSTVSNIQKGTEPKVGMVMSILESLPDLSAEWLMRGTLPMYKSEVPEETVEVKRLKAELEQLKGKYALLKEMYDDKCAELAAQVPHVAYVLKKDNDTK